MQKVMLFSFFNSNNIGDRVIAEIFFSELNSKYSVIPCSIEGSFEIKNQYVPEKLNVCQRIFNKVLQALSIRYLTPRYKRFLNKYRSEVKSCSHVVFGGGNLLMDYSDKSHSYLKLSDYIRVALENNAECYALSIGIGPFYNSKQACLAAETLNKCKKITFRDEKSYRLFVENGGIADKASVSYDPAFLFARINNISTNNLDKENIIAVNVINPVWDGTQKSASVAEGYIRLIGEISKKSPSSKIVLFCTEKNDIPAREYIIKHFPEGNISANNIDSTDDLKALYVKSRIIIGARMHSLIIAYSCHIPVLGLSWASKVDEFFKKINKPEYCFDIYNVEKNIDEICDKINVNHNDWSYDEVISEADYFLQKNLNQII